MRKQVTTSLEDALVKSLKKVAVDYDLNFNDLLEYAISDLLGKVEWGGGIPDEDKRKHEISFWLER